jgi:hypothetical protein
VRHPAVGLRVPHDAHAIAGMRFHFGGDRVGRNDHPRPGGRGVERARDQRAAVEPFEQLLSPEAARRARRQDDDRQALTATRVRIGPVP